MRDFYPPNRLKKQSSISKIVSQFCLVFLLALFLTPATSNAQLVYTVTEGELQSSAQGISPFATSVANQRSQYLYVGSLLVEQGATNGFITKIAVKITQLAQPTNILPQNLRIKMGQTDLTSLPSSLIPNLSVHYATIQENITQTGWYTITLNNPFEWDGYSNIVIEFCRTNQNVGESFEVEVFLGEVGEYRTAGLVSTTLNGNGCTLTGNTAITLPNRRLLPSMRFTMSNPCSGTPNPGTIVVTGGDDYCSSPFTLSATDSSIQSGLSYQWQYSYSGNADFTDIPGATTATLTTTQSFATYYRRGVSCGNSQAMIYPPALYVDGPNCECNPTVSSNNSTGITNVNFGSINNTSASTPYYTNFTAMQTIVNKGAILPLSAKVTVAEAAVTVTTKAWIDWNQNGEFESTEEYNLGAITTGTNVSSGATASVTVPANAELGLTKMRVRSAALATGEVLTACGNFQSGETEDYTIKVEENLGINSSTILASSIVVISQGSQVNIRSTIDPIESINVYDIRGRMLYKKTGLNDTEMSVQLNTVASQLLIVEIKTLSGYTTSRKVSIK